MRVMRAAYLAVSFAMLAAPSLAQQAPNLGVPVSNVVVIDTDELYRSTLFGKRLAADLDNRARALQAENEQITADLTAEEKSLTERRGAMDPAAFRADAAEFDTRVQGIRRARDAAIAAFEADRDNAPRLFLEQVRTTLGTLMIERGAVAILDQRIVFLSLSSIDITKEAITRINADLGDGTDTAADQ